MSEVLSSRVLNHIGSRIYDPSLKLVGVSFKTLPVADRERFTRLAASPGELAKKLVETGTAKEAAVISTCNRFEVVSVGEKKEKGIVRFFDDLFESHLSPDSFYEYQDAHAVFHLYRVASSLDSMIVGEGQILSQVKNAYQLAVEAGAAGKFIHHLFQSAFNVAKKVRSNTSLAEHQISLSYIAVKLAQRIFGDLAERKVLVIGSGEMAELALLHLSSHGCKHVIVANRTVERAAELADRFGGSAISLNELERALGQVDIAIGSLAIDRPILTPQSFRNFRRNDPIFLIDLGVPRNFSPNLANVDQVFLYNIDDLAQISDENKSLREAAAKEAEIVIEHGLLQFDRWRAKVEAEPEMLEHRQRVHAVCKAEIEQAFAGGVEPSLVDRISYRIAQKLAEKS